MKLFSKGLCTDWLRTLERSLGTNYPEQSQSCSLKLPKILSEAGFVAKGNFGSLPLEWVYHNMTFFFFQEWPNGLFIPNFTHFPTAVWRGYKPILYFDQMVPLPMKSHTCKQKWKQNKYVETERETISLVKSCILRCDTHLRSLVKFTLDIMKVRG